MNKNVDVPEQRSARFNVDFTNDGAPVVPTAVFAAIYCMTTRTIVRPDAALSVIGSTTPVLVTAAETSLIDRVANDIEVKRIVLRAIYNVDEQLVTSYDLLVRRVRL